MNHKRPRCERKGWWLTVRIGRLAWSRGTRVPDWVTDYDGIWLSLGHGWYWLRRRFTSDSERMEALGTTDECAIMVLPRPVRVG